MAKAVLQEKDMKNVKMSGLAVSLFVAMSLVHLNAGGGWQFTANIHAPVTVVNIR